MKESGENYLETILILKERNGTVRSVDIANELSFSKASVSRAMKILAEDNMIEFRGNDVCLTEEGYKKASAIYERHRVLSQFFETYLGIDAETAAHDACRIEHVISQVTFEAIKKKLSEML